MKIINLFLLFTLLLTSCVTYDLPLGGNYNMGINSYGMFYAKGIEVFDGDYPQDEYCIYEYFYVEYESIIRKNKKDENIPNGYFLLHIGTNVNIIEESKENCINKLNTIILEYCIDNEIDGIFDMNIDNIFFYSVDGNELSESIKSSRYVISGYFLRGF